MESRSFLRHLSFHLTIRTSSWASTAQILLMHLQIMVSTTFR